METTSWKDVRKPRSEAAQRAYEDEARIREFRELVYRLRTEASFTTGQVLSVSGGLTMAG
jgi:hypothetical protein